MKKIFIEAHKMTREMVKEYNVDYQTQFSLNVSYLLEIKEEKEMLDAKIKQELEKLHVSEEDIQNAERIINKFSTVNREIIEELYDDKNKRRTIKSNNLWDSSTSGISLQERYLGKAECEVTKQKLWVKGDHIRIYFDIKVDGIIEDTGRWIKVA